MIVTKSTRESYIAFAKSQEKALMEYEKLSAFEEKTKKPEDLMYAVVMQANTQQPGTTEGMQKVMNVLGPVTNL
ncbi:hypothetical protein D3C72_2452840 [compost metagenome]